MRGLIPAFSLQFGSPADSDMTLRIGRISYLNVAPYFHYLREAGFTGEIVAGVPSALNAMLAEGTIDACPSSSFEYALHATDYFLLPGHSISSFGPVHSVLLFTPGPLSGLADAEIAITGESATSINLLKILLKEFCGIENARFRVPEGQVEDLLRAGRSCLLIGDRALSAARSCPAGFRVTDLGSLWYHFTGLPFVFALWILRREAVATFPEQIVDLAQQLGQARGHAFNCLHEMASKLSANTDFSSGDLEEYWGHMSYDLTAGHLEGLRLYFTLCHKHGLLASVPEFHFFPDM